MMVRLDIVHRFFDKVDCCTRYMGCKAKEGGYGSIVLK